MNRREVFGRLAGITAAAAALARIKAPRKAEAKDYGFNGLSVDGKPAVFDQYAAVSTSTYTTAVVSTSTYPTLMCSTCHGQVYGYSPIGTRICGCR